MSYLQEIVVNSSANIDSAIILLAITILVGIIGMFIYIAQKKPENNIIAKTRKTFWLMLEMISFGLAYLVMFVLPWMRLGKIKFFFVTLSLFSEKQYSYTFNISQLCDMANISNLVPTAASMLIGLSSYIFIAYIILCFARREQKQPKGIILSFIIAFAVLLVEGFRLYLNSNIGRDDFAYIFSFETTGTFLIVLIFDVAAVVFGILNAKKRDTPINSDAQNIFRKYCSFCGKRIIERKYFCAYCGHSLKETNIEEEENKELVKSEITKVII